MKKGFSIITIVMAAALLSAGCAVQSNMTELRLPKAEDAEITYLTSEEEVLPAAKKIEVLDSTIILCGSLDGKWFHLYDRNTGKVRERHVDGGQGPDDVLMISNFLADTTGTTVYDQPSGFIKKFDRDWKCMSKRRPDFTKDTMVLYNVNFLADGRQLCSINTHKSISKRGLVVERDGVYGKAYLKSPADGEEGEKPELYNRHCVALSPDCKKIAAASFQGFALEIFEIDGMDIKLLAQKQFYPYELVMRGNFINYSDDNIKGALSMIASNKVIVMAYNGTKDLYSPTDITVWDWNGNLLRRFKSDWAISSMAFSPDNPDDLYALVFSKDGNPRLAKFNCPGLQRK